MLFYILKSSFKNKKTSPNLNSFQITTYFKRFTVVIKNVETRGLTSRGATLLHCNTKIYINIAVLFSDTYISYPMITEDSVLIYCPVQ